tara:strand:- start:43 stop:411 length:369 start_codon:yes stop_codon:yes gene_type:complete
MRLLLIFLIFPTLLYADQGVNISCVNMKNLLEKNPRIHKFKFDVVTFQYFDQNKNSFVEVANKNMIIKKDFFAARFPEYELGFQINVFKDDKKPIMSMSKYDYINDKFLEHYICDVQPGYIN